MGGTIDFKLCSIICAFHPSLERLKDLCSTLSTFGLVVVVDNSETIDPVDLSHISNVFILPMQNVGTLKAYNIVINQFTGHDYFWLWNQDTIISVNAATEFIEKSNSSFSDDAALIATTIYDKKNMINPVNPHEVLIKESTTLLNIKRLKKVSPTLFDDKLFMDYGDWDFFSNLQKHGGKIKQIYRIEYKHFLGDPEPTLFGSLYRSSEIRLYMQGLNFVYLLKKRRLLSFINLLLVMRFFILPFKNLLFKNSFKRTLNFWQGILHGLKGEVSSEYMQRINQIN